MDFGEAFITARRVLGLSQKGIASELKLSFCSVNRWENGRHIPNAMTIDVINKYFSSHGIPFTYDTPRKEKKNA